MTTKLVQKHLFKGTREFELFDDKIIIREKSLFKQQELEVVLSILNPEPVIDSHYLHFHSRVKCGPLFSLFLNKPNTEEFNAFVQLIKKRAAERYYEFAGIKSYDEPDVPPGNVTDEPPEFPDLYAEQLDNVKKGVNPVRIREAIDMLNTYVDSDEIRPLLAALEALETNSTDIKYMKQLVEAYNQLGIIQGSVLTYAPYISVILSGNQFDTQ